MAQTKQSEQKSDKKPQENESFLARPKILNLDEQDVLNQNGYVGVDPVYQNAANKTDEPLKASGDKKEPPTPPTPPSNN